MLRKVPSIFDSLINNKIHVANQVQYFGESCKRIGEHLSNVKQHVPNYKAKINSESLMFCISVSSFFILGINTNWLNLELTILACYMISMSAFL